MKPHPNPWHGYGYIEVDLRKRFVCFESEPWFRQVVLAYCVASDRDDEWTMEEIVSSLEETAMLRSIELLPRFCSVCETAKLEIGANDSICNVCEERQEVALSHDAEGCSFIIDGLVQRDVQ